jgi:hypothetical protein
METMYRGGIISANGRTAVITFRAGWSDPGDWDIDYYRGEMHRETVTIREEDTTREDVIKLGLNYTGYDEIALERDLRFLAGSYEGIKKESDGLSSLCFRNASFESIVGQLRKINDEVAALSDLRCSIESHIAVYRAINRQAERL